MKRLVVSMNITLDGFYSGPNCELDWHFNAWGSDMGESLATELGRADTILLGRVTYEAMAKYWPARASDLLCPRDDVAFAVMMNRFEKVVFSRTLSDPKWNNTRTIHGKLAEQVSRLKLSGKPPYRHIIIYGSGKLVSSLMSSGLIDEFHLWVHPVVLGRGKPLFSKARDRMGMQLIGSTAFRSGVVLLKYNV